MSARKVFTLAAFASLVLAMHSGPARAQNTYDRPVTIHVNGEDVHLIPIRNAHTDGDTLISFPGHDILAVGDYFRSTGYPYVDLTNGGTLAGLLAGSATP